MQVLQHQVLFYRRWPQQTTKKWPKFGLFCRDFFGKGSTEGEGVKLCCRTNCVCVCAALLLLTVFGLALDLCSESALCDFVLIHIHPHICTHEHIKCHPSITRTHMHSHPRLTHTARGHRHTRAHKNVQPFQSVTGLKANFYPTVISGTGNENNNNNNNCNKIDLPPITNRLTLVVVVVERKRPHWCNKYPPFCSLQKPSGMAVRFLHQHHQPNNMAVHD